MQALCGILAWRPFNAYTSPLANRRQGNDGAGVIEAIGSDVQGVAVGDRVYMAGSGKDENGSHAGRKGTQSAQPDLRRQGTLPTTPRD